MAVKRQLQRTTGILEYELPLCLERDSGGGYVAFSPVWQECYAQGDTIDEAIAEATAVAASLVELFREEGLPIPIEKARLKNLSARIRVPLFVSAA